ncbi:MAG TPA: hypothetical protein DER60_09920 [Syntrophomonas sp.]|nr:hypothetical protein [Syntrophomonas sp.]
MLLLYTLIMRLLRSNILFHAKSFKEYTPDWFRSTWKIMNFGSAFLPSTLLGRHVGQHVICI